jgi:hypothetical protein
VLIRDLDVDLLFRPRFVALLPAPAVLGPPAILLASLLAGLEPFTGANPDQ